MNHFNAKKLILGASIAVCSMGALQAMELHIRPVISADELFAAPSEVRVKLFDAREGGQFLQEQIFSAGEWTSSRDLSRGLPQSDKLDLNMTMDVPDDLKGQQLWAEISIDGRVIDSRLAASAASSKFTINGDIVLNKEGGDNTDPNDNTGRINFPDGTSMGSVNDAKDDMGDHKALQNIELNGRWLSGDGDDEGVFVSDDGWVGIGTSSRPGSGSQLTVSGSDGGFGGITVVSKNSSNWAPYYEYKNDGLLAKHGLSKSSSNSERWYLYLGGDKGGNKLAVEKTGDILTVESGPAVTGGDHGINIKSQGVPVLKFTDDQDKLLFQMRAFDNGAATSVQFGNDDAASAARWMMHSNFNDFWFDGRMMQSNDWHGLVKASIYTDCGSGLTNPQVYRSFNQLAGTAGSGPTVTHPAPGTCELTFSGNSLLAEAYWTVTPVTTGDNNQDDMRVAQCRKIGHSKLRCNRFAANGSPDNGRIIVTIF